MGFFQTEIWSNAVLDYIIALGIIIGSIIFARIVFKISRNVLKHRAAKTKTQLDDILVTVLEKPVVFLIFVLGLFIALKTLSFNTRITEMVMNIINILTIIGVSWFIIYLIDGFILNYFSPKVAQTKIDRGLVPVIRKIVKVILIIIAITLIISNFGYDISSLIAGLGIGGLAFALAAKDMLSNLFGGISIMTDKPFKIGDRIKVAGYDGWVQEIGLRTTKVKTLDNFQMIIPNSIVANTPVENVSREEARKVKVTIGVEYTTSMKKMEEAKKILEQIIKENPDTKDESIVSFEEFADSSLNFQIIYWIKNLNNILPAKHKINMEIKKRFEKAKISMAFPTRTVYVKK